MRDYKYTPDYSQNKLPYYVLKIAGDYNFCMMNCIGVIGNWSSYFYYEVFAIESQYLPLNEDKCYMDYIQKEISPLNFIQLLMGNQNFDITYQKANNCCSYSYELVRTFFFKNKRIFNS